MTTLDVRPPAAPATQGGNTRSCVAGTGEGCASGSWHAAYGFLRGQR